MTKPTPKAKRPTSAPGVKALITAGALAATLIGWAGIAAEARIAAASSPETALVADVPAWLLEPPIIPSAPALGAAQAPVTQQVAPAAPVLRDVTAPPQPARRPITMTRSSR